MENFELNLFNILLACAGETMPIRTTNKILSFENIKNLCNFEGRGKWNAKIASKVQITTKYNMSNKIGDKNLNL